MFACACLNGKDVKPEGAPKGHSYGTRRLTAAATSLIVATILQMQGCSVDEVNDANPTDAGDPCPQGRQSGSGGPSSTYPCQCENRACAAGHTCSHAVHNGTPGTRVCACSNGRMACCNLYQIIPTSSGCSEGTATSCPSTAPRVGDECGPHISFCLYPCGGQTQGRFCDGQRWQEEPYFQPTLCQTEAGGADSADGDAATADATPRRAE